jgi:D-alanyl-D-alanine carboxypeptidase (penicillin-binding protein 5/6)
MYLKNFYFSFLIIVFFLGDALAKSDDLKHNLVESQFYFLIDADTKEVLLSKNPDIRIAPSSMTKLMTAYVVFDQIKNGRINFSNQCLIGKDAWRKSGSSMFLNYGDVVSIEDLVKGLLVVSGNDAAIALAESTANGTNNFVSLMNSKAKEIGLKNSHFRNPHGLAEDGHYMTIRDLATLAMRLYQDFPEYVKYLGMPEFTYGNITQHNRNPLIKKSYEGVIGGKTGYTNDGGYGVVGIVKRDNRLLVAVVNKAKSARQRESMITELLDYGFYQYKKIALFEKDQTIASVKTWLGKKSEVEVATNREITFNIPRGKPIDSVKVSVKYNSPIYAPISKGVKVASLIVEVQGYKTFEYSLFAKEKIDKAGYFTRMRQVLRYKIANFKNKIF